MLDEMDRKILEALQADGRMTNVELAQKIGLTPAPTLARVNKLEAQGFITGYTALIDRESIGMDVTVFVAVIMKSHGSKESREFLDRVCQFKNVVEVHHIAGNEDYLLKIVAPSTRAYEKFLLEELSNLDGVQRLNTTFVLSSAKSTTHIPIPSGGGILDEISS